MRLSKKQTHGFKYKILLVDDDQGCIDALEHLLSKRNCFAKGFTRPEDALNELRLDNTYDIIISDYFMTPITGDELIRCVRKFNRDIVAVIFTGYADKGVFDFPTDLRVEKFFEKGNNFKELLDWIDE